MCVIVPPGRPSGGYASLACFGIWILWLSLLAPASEIGGRLLSSKSCRGWRASDPSSTEAVVWYLDAPATQGCCSLVVEGKAGTWIWHQRKWPPLHLELPLSSERFAFPPPAIHVAHTKTNIAGKT